VLTVLYDRDCGVCSETARALAKLDRRRALRLQPLQDAAIPGQPSLDQLLDALHAVDETGRWWVGADAMVEIARRIPLLRPVTVFTHVPGAGRAADELYRLVADNRQMISRVLGMTACKRPEHAYGHTQPQKVAGQQP
jgi:predicted DCC family thiol-disulfide oxidoreductase YuxK